MDIVDFMPEYRLVKGSKLNVINKFLKESTSNTLMKIFNF